MSGDTVASHSARVIQKLENNYNAFDLKSRGIFVWERMRDKVHRNIINKKMGGQTKYNNNIKNYKRILLESIRNIFCRNPLFLKETDILTLGHQRRKYMKDGLWWDIYCDPVYSITSRNYTHMEYPYMFTHKRPAKTENLKYLDILENISRVYKCMGKPFVKVEQEVINTLKKIKKELYTKLDVKVNLVNTLKKIILDRSVKLPFFERVIKKVNPKLVLLVTSYMKESFVEACKNTNTKVAELQHGAIDNMHLGYSYPNKKDKNNFPDYFLAFGEYWKDTTNLPIRSEEIFCVGYPFLENYQTENNKKRALDKEGIVFISQSIIGKSLSKFAIEVYNYEKVTDNIYYKLHPKEYDGWRRKYPWLQCSGISVVGEDGPELYELFERASIQIGVYSTALYEGIYFGLDTLIYKATGYERVKNLVQRGIATNITKPNDIPKYKSNITGDKHSSYLFEDNSKEKLRSTIEDIIEE